MPAKRIPTTCTIADLARILGLNRSTVEGHVADRTIEVLPDGGVDICKAVQAYVNKIKRSAQNTNERLKEEQARLTEAKADREEIKLAKERGEVIDGDMVEQVWGDMAMAAKARLLALPTRAAGRLPVAPEDLSETKEILDAEVRETLMEIADYEPTKFIEGLDEEDGEELDASSETDSQPVGRPAPRAKRGGGKRGRKVANKSS